MNTEYKQNHPYRFFAFVGASFVAGAITAVAAAYTLKLMIVGASTFLLPITMSVLTLGLAAVTGRYVSKAVEQHREEELENYYSL